MWQCDICKAIRMSDHDAAYCNSIRKERRLQALKKEKKEGFDKFLTNKKLKVKGF